MTPNSEVQILTELSTLSGSFQEFRSSVNSRLDSIQGGIQSHTQQLAAQGNSQAALPCDSHKERIEKLERIVNRLLWMAGILTGGVALLGFLVNTGIELVKLKLSLH